MVVCERLGRMNVVEVLEEWVDWKVRNDVCKGLVK